MSKIDDSIFRKMGMTILTADQVRTRKRSDGFIPWPSDKAFRPKGISLQEARDAMAKCVGKKVCKQCNRSLPKSHFDVTDKAREANPGIEDYCSLCWACP